MRPRVEPRHHLGTIGLVTPEGHARPHMF